MLALRPGLLQLHHRVNEHLLGDGIGPHPYIDAGQSLLAGISAAGASIVTINQSTPENGAALVAVTIRTDTMQMTPEELTEKLSRQRMVVGVHCGYNL